MTYPNPQFETLTDPKTELTFLNICVVKKTIFNKVITDKNKINSYKFEVANVEFINSSKFTHNGCEYNLLDFDFNPVLWVTHNIVPNERFKQERDEILHDKITNEYFRYESYNPSNIYSVSAKIGDTYKLLYLGDIKKNLQDIKNEMIRKQKIKVLIHRFVEIIAMGLIFYVQFNPSPKTICIPISIVFCLLSHELFMIL